MTTNIPPTSEDMKSPILLELLARYLVVVSLGLGAVAAALHAAPATAVVAAGIDKYIAAAAIVSTFSHPFNFSGCNQVRRLSRQRPDNPV